MKDSGQPIRAARADMGDDIVLPFTVEALNIRGRIAHLGPVVDTALRQHRLPQPVARLLAEMLALTAVLGTTLKFQGKLIAQSQSDGPVRLLVADFAAPGSMRGLARFDEDRVQALMERGPATPEDLLGTGQLVFTLDQGPHMQRYQGVVRLHGSLQRAVEEYFATSEQIPTRVRLTAGTLLDESGEHWRAGAMMIQHLPASARAGTEGGKEQGREADDWATAEALFDTLEDQELLDPSISPERLAYRLFHEYGVRVFEPVTVKWKCRCSRDGLLQALRRFSPQERARMVEEDGKIRATCEFCATSYEFTPEELERPAS